MATGMICELVVPDENMVLIGRPARTMPQERSEAIARLVESIDGVLEAYLPQCFVVEMMESPDQVLVVVLDPEADAVEVINLIKDGLKQILPSGKPFHIWPLPLGDSMLRTMRQIGSGIHPANR